MSAGFGEYEYESPYAEAEYERPYGEAEGGPDQEAEDQFLFPFRFGRGHGRGYRRDEDWRRDRWRGRRWREAEYEAPFGEAEDESPFGEAEDEAPFGAGGRYGRPAYEGPNGSEAESPFGEAESPYGEAEFEDEEQFLPALIPIIGSLLGGLFNKEAEAEAEAAGGYGEAEEQFLGGVLGGVLGEAARAASPLSPAQEARLAGELLEVSSEEDLEQFLQGVVNTVSRAYHGARDFAASPTGRAVIDVLKPVAKAALPVVGGAIGSRFGGSAGGTAGRAVGQAIADSFEVDMSRHSPQEAEFEVARGVVRTAARTASIAGHAAGRGHPHAVAGAALLHASRRHAPGIYHRALLRSRPFAHGYHHGRARYGHRHYGRRGYGGSRGYGPRGYYGRRAHYGRRRYGWDGPDDFGPSPEPVIPPPDVVAAPDGPPAPGQCPPGAAPQGEARAISIREGRWVRRGRRIVLLEA